MIISCGRRSSDAAVDLDQLRPSLYGVVPALCDGMGCAHPVGIVPGSVLRGTIRVHRHRLQRVRARSIGPRGRVASVRADATYRQAPITCCPCDLHDRYAGCIYRAAPQLRPDMRRPDSPLAARCLRQHSVVNEVMKEMSILDEIRLIIFQSKLILSFCTRILRVTRV
jgi:hypothetical protein